MSAEEQTTKAASPATIPPALERPQGFASYWAWPSIILLAIVLWLPRLSGPIDLRWDGGVYYLLGTSLRTGHGYRILSEPGSPEAIQYPPLLPAIVALHERALGTTDPAIVAPWLRRSYAAMFILFGVSLLALARRFLPAGLAFLAAALCLCQIMTVFMSDLLFTELPFALISVCFLLVAANARERQVAWVNEARSFSLAAAGFLLRTAGLALLGAWVLDGFLQRHWRLSIGRAFLATVPIFAWQMHVRAVRSSDDYAHPAYQYQRAAYQYYNVSYAENIALVDPFRPELGRAHLATIAHRLIANIAPMFKAIGETVSTKEDFWSQIANRSLRRLGAQKLLRGNVALIPIFALSAATLLGLVMFVRRRAWIFVSVIVISLALSAATPWPAQFSRYLMPVAPLLAICLMEGSRVIWTSLGRQNRFFVAGKIGIVAVLTLVLLMQAYALLKAFRQRGDQLPAFASGKIAGPKARLFYHSEAWLSWEKAVDWIRTRAPPEAIVATSAPHFLYLLTHRQSVLPPFESDPDRAEALLASVPVRYVIVDKLGFVDASRRYARPAVESNPAAWRLAYSHDGTNVYERVSP